MQLQIVYYKVLFLILVYSFNVWCMQICTLKLNALDR